jgi:hypothetical protein
MEDLMTEQDVKLTETWLVTRLQLRQEQIARQWISSVNLLINLNGFNSYYAGRKAICTDL